MEIKSSHDEVIVAEFRPSSIAVHLPYLFGHRNKLVLTNKRVILYGALHLFDKEILYGDISDVLVNNETGALDITKKGTRPAKRDPLDGVELFKAYLSCTWLNDPDEVASIVKSSVAQICTSEKY